MDLLALHEEIIHDIIIMVSLDNIIRCSLVCHRIKIMIDSNWLDYFIYHTQIPVLLLENFKPIDRQFMINHGKSLLNIEHQCVIQYLSIWKDLENNDIYSVFNNGKYYSFITFRRSNADDNSIDGIVFATYDDEAGLRKISEFSYPGLLEDSDNFELSQLQSRFKHHLLRTQFVEVLLWVREKYGHDATVRKIPIHINVQPSKSLIFD